MEKLDGNKMKRLLIIYMAILPIYVYSQGVSVTKSVSIAELRNPKSVVDRNIPERPQNNENTFVVIIANENYKNVGDVEYALNDGKIFYEYCNLTLGIPKENIRLVQNATKNDIDYNVKWLGNLMNALNGTANAILYYAGHGIPDDVKKDAYLLPVDGYGTETSTGCRLSDIYSYLGAIDAKKILILLDACFSGAMRDGSMMVSSRGVAIKAQPQAPKGNMVVLSATKDNETAAPYMKEKHGLFTFFLLKKLQESAGNATLEEISTYVTEQVARNSILVNGKSQTPSTYVSTQMGDDWKSWKLK